MDKMTIFCIAVLSLFVIAFIIVAYHNKPSQPGAPIKARDDFMELNNAD